MKTFEEHISDVVASRGSFNILFESGMYSLLSDLDRIVKLLRDAGVSFEVIGGVAVNTHLLASGQRSRMFVTADVDLLAERGELPQITRAAESAGYQAKKIVGGYMLIRPGQRVAEAVHIVFAGEKSKSTQAVVHPQVRPEEMALFELEIPVAPLVDLVQMKLSSLRAKDVVHLEILEDAGMITPDIEAALPEALRENLKDARRQFERDRPDVDN
jgi:hypothetical protein